MNIWKINGYIWIAATALAVISSNPLAAYNAACAAFFCYVISVKDAMIEQRNK